MRLFKTSGDSASEAYLASLLRTWRDLINAIERGYPNVIEEYEDDLAVRDRIEELILKSDNVSKKQQHELLMLDLRFNRCTFDPVWRTTNESRPWTMRVPRRLEDNLRADIAEEELEAVKNSVTPAVFTPVDEAALGPHVWIFHTQMSSGVFSTKALADHWISENRLTGTLTAYALDTGVYQWATKRGLFRPKCDHDRTPRRIQSFDTASLPHFHYEFGLEQVGSVGSGL